MVRYFRIDPKIVVLVALFISVSLDITPVWAGDRAVHPPKNGFEAAGIDAPKSIFGKGIATKSFFTGEIVHVNDELEEQENADATSNKKTTENTKNEQIKEEVSASNVLSDTEAREKILDRVDRNATEPFLNMVKENRTGNTKEAKRQAGLFVDYMLDLIFEVRTYTQMIGEQLVKKQVIEEEEWDGVEQFIDWTFAQGRNSSGAVLKATHDSAMRRITPDAKAEVEIYYFFTLNSKWSRLMAADIERLWRSVKRDPRVKMVALTLGPVPQAWIDSYRDYTGLTLPIQNGEEVAKAFNIAFVPAMVAVSPNQNKAYVKTGQQSFERMYEFVRTVQGVDSTFTPKLVRLAQTPIGELEQGQGRGMLKPVALKETIRPAVRKEEYTIERF